MLPPSELDTVQAELAAAQRRAERAEAEAALARQLLAELRVAPRERGSARRKADGPAPITNEEQGAPALPATWKTAKMARKIERADTIRWIQAQMADYGLTMDELKAAGCFDPPPPRPVARPVCYRTPRG